MTGINAKSLQQLRDFSSYPLPQLEKLAANLSIRQFKKRKLSLIKTKRQSSFIYSYQGSLGFLTSTAMKNKL